VPPEHFVPQAPQLLLSEDGVTQVPLQFKEPDLQQSPERQAFPLPHLILQPPQLLTSVLMLEQPEEQAV
jgi:hypothetical protein